MLRFIERHFGVLMLALMVASAIGCSSKPRMVELNLGIDRDAKLEDRRVVVHLVGVSTTALEEWTDNTPQKYWEPNNHLRDNADRAGLIHKINTFTPDGELGPVWLRADDDIWNKWRATGAMTLLIYAQGVLVESLTGDNQVLKQLPIDSDSYVRRQSVRISIEPSQIAVNTPPKPQD